MKQEGILLSQLQNAGFGVEKNCNLSTPKIARDLKNAGYTLKEFISNYSLKFIVRAGFTFEDIICANVYTIEDLKKYFTQKQLDNEISNELKKKDLSMKLKF